MLHRLTCLCIFLPKNKKCCKTTLMEEGMWEWNGINNMIYAFVFFCVFSLYGSTLGTT